MADEERWRSTDRLLADLVVGDDPVLETALRANAAASLPAIDVSPLHGKLLYLLARAIDARSILELGTLGGYSTIWLARALADGGKVVTVEVDPRHAAVAAENIARAGLAHLVEQRVQPALEALDALRLERTGPFDLVFVDADKERTPEYFVAALDLTRRGGLIVVDNVVRAGAIASPGAEDSRAQGMRRFLELLAVEPRVEATVIQTVGSKGYDGFALARLRS